jgi:hypothetical protein
MFVYLMFEYSLCTAFSNKETLWRVDFRKMGIGDDIFHFPFSILGVLKSIMFGSGLLKIYVTVASEYTMAGTFSPMHPNLHLGGTDC